jgi:2-keto-4-pentenoate hydratase
VSAGARARDAARLLGALRGSAARPGALPEALAPRSESEAYEVQAALAEQLGASICGWKASMSGPDRGQAAPLYRTEIHDSPARLPSPGGERLGIEPEIAFTLDRDLDALPGGRRYGLAELEAAIAAVHPVIEIVNSRFASLDAAPPLDRLADNLSNAGLVRGAACRDWRALGLEALPLRLEVIRADGSRSVHEGRGGHAFGNPRLPLLWLANDAIARGTPLRRGDLVTTGSCAGLHPVARGSRILVTFGGLGAVQLELS